MGRREKGCKEIGQKKDSYYLYAWPEGIKWGRVLGLMLVSPEYEQEFIRELGHRFEHIGSGPPGSTYK